MTAPDKKLGAKLRKLHAMLGSDNAGERETARAKITEILAKNKKTWNDLLVLIAVGDDRANDIDEAPLVNPVKTPAPLDLVDRILERHLHLDDHQRVAIALWIMHSHVFSRFSITPRLAFISPVRGTGKTTTLGIVEALSLRAVKVDNITPAVLFRMIDRDRSALLLDEADNQDLLNNPTLRSVINSGHRRGGKIMRFLDGVPREFSTFAPLAIAAIGSLPMPVLHRSVVIHMERSPVALLPFDPHRFPEQKVDCHIVYQHLFEWARGCDLDLNPPLPEELRNRPADNWRVLISIADASHPEWGELARAAAIALSGNQDEDLVVTLLEDIRTIFNRRPSTDHLAGAAIVAELAAMDDAPWSEWRGPRGDQSPRNLSQAQLAHVLTPFGIRSRVIWPSDRASGGKSSRGYFRKDFEVAWSAYCTDVGAPTGRRGMKPKLVGR